MIERQNTIKLFLHGQDIIHIHMFQLALNTDYPIEHYVNNYYVSKGCQPSNMSGLRVRSKQMFDDLCRLGCTPRKSYNLKFPTEQQVPKEFQRDFIRGFTDGDGSINFSTPKKKRVYSIEWGCCSKSMLNSLLKFIKEIGFDTSVNIKKVKGKNEFYKLSFTGNNLARGIINYLYSDATTYLWRKRNIVNEMNEYLDRYENLKALNKEARKLDLEIEKYNKIKN